ncbi:hypothetical protein PMIN03_008693 [Paraphaeosphaeria minitans]
MSGVCDYSTQSHIIYAYYKIHQSYINQKPLSCSRTVSYLAYQIGPTFPRFLGSANHWKGARSSSSSDFQLHQVALNQPIARAPAAVVPSARPQ